MCDQIFLYILIWRSNKTILYWLHQMFPFLGGFKAILRSTHSFIHLIPSWTPSPCNALVAVAIQFLWPMYGVLLLKTFLISYRMRAMIPLNGRGPSNRSCKLYRALRRSICPIRIATLLDPRDPLKSIKRFQYSHANWQFFRSWTLPKIQSRLT